MTARVDAEAAPETHRPRLDVLDDMVGFHIRHAQLHAFQQFDRAIRRHIDISPSQFAVLVVVCANPGISQGELCQTLLYNKATMVGLIDAVEARGLVTRRTPDGDRRVRAIHATAEGLAVTRELKSRVGRLETQMTNTLTADERDELVRLLAKFCRFR